MTTDTRTAALVLAALALVAAVAGAQHALLTHGPQIRAAIDALLVWQFFAGMIFMAAATTACALALAWNGRRAAA